MFAQDPCTDSDVVLLPARPPRRVTPADLAERALRNSPYLSLRNIVCEYRDGVLTLRGCLPTYYLKQVAQAVVAHIDGVRQLVNEIEVASGEVYSVGRV
jgi:osmotically-inducible protein OsmY